MDPTKRQGQTHVEANLEPADRLRLGRLARELRLTDQILSTDLDSVTITEQGPAPAWTTLDGDHIHFALDRMPTPESNLDVAVWLGTNAHELGHVLYSPRRSSDLMRRVIEGEKLALRGIADLHNIVEDQRQERLLLARFAPWTAYLTAALGYHLIVEDESAWLLLAGRTWLSAEIRSAARARFVSRFGESGAVEVAAVVGEYQRLTDPGETEADDAWALLLRLQQLLDTDLPQLSNKCQTLEGGEPDTSEAPESAPAAADEAESDEQGESDQDDASGDESDQEGDESGQGEQGSGEAEGNGAGEGRTDPQGGRKGESLRRALSDAAAEAIAVNPDAAADLASVLEALRSGPAGDGAVGAERVGTHQPATDAARRLRHEVADALLDLKDAVEPGWMKRTDSGRLNVRRLIGGADADELFDRYEPGHLDATELELVLLLDVSGSMRANMLPLAEATWAIRHAVDDLEGTATVIAWDSGPHRIVAAPGDRPDERMFVPESMGGTVPISALTEAYRLTADSTARNRIVVVLTDGMWGLPAKAEQLIAGLNEAGVTTALAALGSYAGDDAHGCGYFAQINDLGDLARLFGKVAADSIGA